ncbi:MAG: electron transport complex subunit RsxE, partial [Candidatus Bipolaricaulia bacterium]
MAENIERAQAQAPATTETLPTWRRWTKTESFKELVKDIWDDNPTFRMVLAMCPTLAVTNTATNAVGMALATTFSVAASSATVSLIRNIVPDRVRIASYMIIIAFYVTLVDLFLKAYIPSLSKQLGPYVALIITNCFILGRAEAYASGHRPWLATMDALGTGFGFLMSLTLLGVVRELLGFGSIFGLTVFGDWWTPWVLM